MPFNNIGEILSNVKKVSRDIEERLDLESLSQSQAPTIFWIGCADSRVSPNIVTGTDLGDMFVHRNVANLANLDDMNFVAAMEYAVGVLKVKHLVICGHSDCGGVNAAFKKSYPTENLKFWLSRTEEHFSLHAKKINQDLPEKKKVNLLAQLNAKNQIKTLLKHPLIKEKVEKDELELHALFYDIRTSSLELLLSLSKEKTNAA